MLNPRLLASSALFLVIIASSVMGQPDESIQLGKVTLRLEDSRPDVSARLTSVYSVLGRAL